MNIALLKMRLHNLKHTIQRKHTHIDFVPDDTVSLMVCAGKKPFFKRLPMSLNVTVGYKTWLYRGEAGRRVLEGLKTAYTAEDVIAVAESEVPYSFEDHEMPEEIATFMQDLINGLAEQARARYEKEQGESPSTPQDETTQDNEPEPAETVVDDTDYKRDSNTL